MIKYDNLYYMYYHFNMDNTFIKKGEKMKGKCLENHIKNIDFFKYNGLSIYLEEIDGDV